MALPDTSSTNREAFNRWRPRIHLIAPRGWLNDPCAPGYNPATGKYHVGFQWNPSGWNWGNISWGAATSEDLVNWKVSKIPSIAPSAIEDIAGVFTGAITEARLSRKGSGDHLSCFYTSAQGSNIHYTQPYERGSEKLHAATSIDGGLSWQRHPKNPIVPGPPEHLSVTGWRDPYTFRSSHFDSERGLRPGSTLYGIVSGGLRDKSPTIFLYTIDETNPTKWTFLSTLLEHGLNFCTTALGGDFGVNWEVANVTTLQDQSEKEFTVLIVGVEGCKVTDALSAAQSTPRSTRTGRSQRWLCGRSRSSLSTDELKMSHEFSGVLDWGIFYAANSFFDPISKQRVVCGWILEEDLSDGLREQQGWSGCVSLPRVLSMQTIHGVDIRCKGVLDAVPGFAYEEDVEGRLEVTTICCRPAPQLKDLRYGDAVAIESLARFGNPRDSRAGGDTSLEVPGLASLELDALFTFDRPVESFGIDVLHSSDHKFFTRILFSPSHSLITIDRSHSRCSSSAAPASISLHDEVAYHAFLSLHSSTSNAIKPENLEIQLFFDVSVLEVFINSRTVLTTRVYPESGKCFGVVPFVVGEGTGMRMERCNVWELRASIE